MHHKEPGRIFVAAVCLPGIIDSAYKIYQHFAISSTGMIELNGLAITMVITGLFLCLIDAIDRRVNHSYLDDDF